MDSVGLLELAEMGDVLVGGCFSSMIQLTREYRFFWRNETPPSQGGNSWGGRGNDLVPAPYVQLRATVAGVPDAETGYLVNIQVIDRALAAIVENRIAPLRGTEANYVNALLQTKFLVDVLPDSLQIVSTELTVSPYCYLRLKLDHPMAVSLTQQFEFSAAHRLHSESLSPEENQNYFGKCNNPAGHGHNYVVAVTVRLPSGPEGAPGFSLQTMESHVKQRVIDRLDHKHLNVDVPEFKNVNPSVENIAQVVWGYLAEWDGGGTLENVRVYETPKTWADYAGNTPF